MSDYLTDEEQLDKLRNWWEKNGLAMLGAVIVAVAGVVGWNWYDDHRAEQISRASDLYVDYLNAEGAERDNIEATLASEFPDSTYQVLVLLRKAESSMTAEDAPAALEVLQQALSATSDRRLADLIRLRIARLQQELEQSESALATLAAVRSAGLRSHVQEIKGDIHMMRGERSLAHEAYSAALAEAGDRAQRPLLEMKVADTADTNDA